MAQQDALLQYWGVVCGNHRRGWIGYAYDFYPEEEVSHRRWLERGGAILLGAFDSSALAQTAVRQELQRLCDEHNRSMTRAEEEESSAG